MRCICACKRCICACKSCICACKRCICACKRCIFARVRDVFARVRVVFARVREEVVERADLTFLQLPRPRPPLADTLSMARTATAIPGTAMQCHVILGNTCWQYLAILGNTWKYLIIFGTQHNAIPGIQRSPSPCWHLSMPWTATVLKTHAVSCNTTQYHALHCHCNTAMQCNVMQFSAIPAFQCSVM